MRGGTFSSEMIAVNKPVVALAIAALALGTAAIPAQAQTVAAAAQPQNFAIVNVVDGDTVRVATGRGIKTVRLLGVDAPETGRCLAFAARSFTSSFVQRQRVNGVRVVIPSGFVGKTDRYGRLMGYVQSRTSDLGTALLQNRLAVARYDSVDGNPRHPRQGTYRAITPGRASAPGICVFGPVPKPPPPPDSIPQFEKDYVSKVAGWIVDDVRAIDERMLDGIGVSNRLYMLSENFDRLLDSPTPRGADPARYRARVLTLRTFASDASDLYDYSPSEATAKWVVLRSETPQVLDAINAWLGTSYRLPPRRAM